MVVLQQVPAESPEAEEEQQRLLSNSYKQLVRFRGGSLLVSARAAC